ncbi:MAG TPA: PilZ domain-containing protein [Nitrospirota bacterium]|nr:PilZ domain-containing protein [Nitrospirota bacterium]
MKRKNYLQYLTSLFFQKPFKRVRGKSLQKTIPALPEEPFREEDEHIPVSLSFREKRRHPRSSVEKTVTYSILSGDGTEEESGLQAYVVNISEGGIGILTDRPLEHGRALRFHDESAQGIGIVRWRIKFVHRNIYRIGIQFIAESRYPSR